MTKTIIIHIDEDTKQIDLLSELDTENTIAVLLNGAIHVVIKSTDISRKKAVKMIISLIKNAYVERQISDRGDKIP